MLQRIRDLIEKYRDEEKFFQRIALHFPQGSSEYMLIKKAYSETDAAFKSIGAVRDDGSPYVSHPIAVAVIVLEYLRKREVNLIVAGLLHDNIEDLNWTFERINRDYGQEVAELVYWNSKPDLELFAGDKVERDKEHHARLGRAPRSPMYVKLSDRLHNLLTLSKQPLERQKNKIEETRAHYLHYAEQHTILFHELEFAMKEVELTWDK